MPVDPSYLESCREAFAPLKWATPYLASSDWEAHERDRGNVSVEYGMDRHCRLTLQCEDGISHWLELVQKPTAGTNDVLKTVTIVKYGEALNGFPGILHGGAVATLMDEALGFAMVASEIALYGRFGTLPPDWKTRLAEGQLRKDVLKGNMVTAKLEIKFLKAVPCPGLVGIEVDILERKGHMIKVRGMMKDESGALLAQADGLWVRIGGARL
jgi:acyl-coenzyme A thioesterase PaaI-like protein